MATSTTPSAGSLVHRPVRAYPRPLPAIELTVAAPPTVGWSASSLAGWLQYLVPLVGSGRGYARTGRCTRDPAEGVVEVAMTGRYDPGPATGAVHAKLWTTSRSLPPTAPRRARRRGAPLRGA